MKQEEEQLIREREQEHGELLRQSLPELTFEALRGAPPDRGRIVTRTKRPPKPGSPITGQTTSRSR